MASFRLTLPLLLVATTLAVTWTSAAAQTDDAESARRLWLYYYYNYYYPQYYQPPPQPPVTPVPTTTTKATTTVKAPVPGQSSTTYFFASATSCAYFAYSFRCSYVYSGNNVYCVCLSPLAAQLFPPNSATTASPPTTKATTTVAATTTTASTASITTTPPPPPPPPAAKLCPQSGRLSTVPSSLRLGGLGTTSVADCTVPGVARIKSPLSDGDVTLCTVAVISKTEVQTADRCIEAVKDVLKYGMPAQLVVGNSIITLTEAMLNANTKTITVPSLPADCPGVACIYNLSMKDKIDTYNCAVYGYGSAPKELPTSKDFPTELQRMQVYGLRSPTFSRQLINDSTQNIPQREFLNSKSDYISVTTAAANLCSGDSGALLMCPNKALPTELVVVGYAATFPCTSSGGTIFFEDLGIGSSLP